MTHTKDLLADELLKLGLMDMSLKARGGYYHDFLSPLATPEMQLCDDLAAAAKAQKDPTTWNNIMGLRRRVINGDFDASSEESDEWVASPEGQAAFNELTKGKRS